MPRITFIEDVILPNEKEGTGPHYRRGYSPDVSEDEARKWIRSGKAVMGCVVLNEPETIKYAPDEIAQSFDIPMFKRKKSRARE